MKITKEYDLNENVHVVELDISDNPQLMAMHNAIQWDKYCECNGIDENPTFYRDNSHKGCVEYKHHYHCSMCGLISQVG